MAILQVNGGSQSFNTVNSLRILGRWMRMFVIPNQVGPFARDCRFKADRLFRSNAWPPVLFTIGLEVVYTRWEARAIFQSRPLSGCV